MAITNYATLKSAISNWAHRTDSLFVAEVPNFIALAEADIRTRLTARAQGIAGSITTAPGVAFAAQPTGLLSAYSLSIPTLMPTVDYVTPDQFSAQYNSGEAGVPSCYTIIGEKFFFGPTPDAVYIISCSYKAEVPALSDVAPTNAVLTRSPNIYLFGAMVEASRFTRDFAAKDRWDSDYQQAVAGVNLLDWHAGGPLRARTDVRM